MSDNNFIPEAGKIYKFSKAGYSDKYARFIPRPSTLPNDDNSLGYLKGTPLTGGLVNTLNPVDSSGNTLNAPTTEENGSNIVHVEPLFVNANYSAFTNEITLNTEKIATQGFIDTNNNFSKSDIKAFIKDNNTGAGNFNLGSSGNTSTTFEIAEEDLNNLDYIGTDKVAYKLSSDGKVEKAIQSSTNSSSADDGGSTSSYNSIFVYDSTGSISTESFTKDFTTEDTTINSNGSLSNTKKFTWNGQEYQIYDYNIETIKNESKKNASATVKNEGGTFKIKSDSIFGNNDYYSLTKGENTFTLSTTDSTEKIYFFELIDDDFAFTGVSLNNSENINLKTTLGNDASLTSSSYTITKKVSFTFNSESTTSSTSTETDTNEYSVTLDYTLSTVYDIKDVAYATIVPSTSTSTTSSGANETHSDLGTKIKIVLKKDTDTVLKCENVTSTEKLGTDCPVSINYYRGSNGRIEINSCATCISSFVSDTETKFYLPYRTVDADNNIYELRSTSLVSGTKYYLTDNNGNKLLHVSI